MNPAARNSLSSSFPTGMFSFILHRTAFYVLALVAIMFLIVGTAAAKKVTYTGFTITDGKLGSWEFHNARVYLTFE